MIERSVDINLSVGGHIEQVLLGIAVGYVCIITEGCGRGSKSAQSILCHCLLGSCNLEDWVSGWEVDGTGSGSCAVAGFGISGVEPSGSATRELVN